MANLSTLQTQIGDAGASLNEFISNNKSTLITTGAIVGAAALGVGAVSVVSKIRNGKKRKSSRSNKSRGRARDRRFISKQKHERRYAAKHPKRRKTGRYYKKRSKPARLVKGSKAAKAYMAKLRRMRK